MTKKTDNFNRNPNGSNQWKTRSNEEIQKIINRYPKHWTKKDFRGEGKNNQNKILIRKETERTGLVFGSTGGVKQYQNGKLKCSICGTFKSLDNFPMINMAHQMVKKQLFKQILQKSKIQTKFKRNIMKFRSF